jgi:hypothetical protein
MHKITKKCFWGRMKGSEMSRISWFHSSLPTLQVDPKIIVLTKLNTFNRTTTIAHNGHVPFVNTIYVYATQQLEQ